MMKKKKYPASLIILALLGALFLYVKFFEKGAKKEQGQVQIFSIDRNSVTRVELKKNNKETVLIKEGSSGKWMLSPKNVLARKDMVDSMLDELSDFTAERKISGDLKDMKLFGLDKPKYFFNVFQGNIMAASVVFGDNSPVGGMVYMKEGKKPALYAVMSFRADKFNKEEKDLREMQLLFFETEKMKEFSIKGQSAEFVFQKQGEDWRLLNPQKKVMKEAVPDLVNALQFLQATRFVDDHPKDLKKYGLDTGLFMITLKVEGKEQAFKVSRRAKDVYAWSSENPSVAVIAEDTLKKIQEAIHKAKEVEKSPAQKTATPLTPSVKEKSK